MTMFPKVHIIFGWLGYFIGKNNHLTELRIDTIENDIKSFLQGINNNRSITTLDFRGMDLLGGRVFTMLDSFFKHNLNLTKFSLSCCILGDDGRLLAFAIGSKTNKSFESVKISNTNISDEGLVNIITALSMHPNLQSLELGWNRLRTNGCLALATLLQNSATKLHTLDLGSSEINDEEMKALVPALKSCNLLHRLVLNNTRVTSKGWQHLATILENPNSKLGILYIAVNNNVDDEAIIAFTRAMGGNNTLYGIYMYDTIRLTDGSHAWKEFSKLLCDTSSVNATFLSNHTLQEVHTGANFVITISPLLALNRRQNKKEVAMIKILQHHNDFDMTPFFEWEFKVLPLMINWFERASAIKTLPLPRNFEPNNRRRKLSSIYQFVRGMPLLYVETRLRQELVISCTGSNERGRAMVDQRERLAEDRKKSIM